MKATAAACAKPVCPVKVAYREAIKGSLGCRSLIHKEGITRAALIRRVNDWDLTGLIHRSTIFRI